MLRQNDSRDAEPRSVVQPSAPARSPWSWIPTLYVAEGMPAGIASAVSVVLYKDLGISNARIAFYTAWLSLPWVIKPLWSPIVEMLRTRRLWIWSMQLFLGAALAGIALTLPASSFFQLSLAFFWLLAFSSATHDIAADGFYLHALTEREQSFFSGIRNTFFRGALICAQGLLVMAAGIIGERTGNKALAWQIAFGAAVGIFLLLALYHRRILPAPASDAPNEWKSPAQFARQFFDAFREFFRKPKIGTILLFLLLYRFGEAQLVRMVSPFLLDPRAAGGLGLSTAQVGLVYGTLGLIALLLGGIAGGILVSRHGLRAWLWPMVFVMHLPDAVFIYLSMAQPRALSLIGTALALEQFGYGFGFTAYMLYMIYIARGPHQTAHYAIAAGFMALGLMLPGMWSGRLQELMGYRHFFIWILAATIPGFIVTALISLPKDFGKEDTPADVA